METLLIPTEKDFKRWIKEALQEYFDRNPAFLSGNDPGSQEPLLNRKQVAGMLEISLVTLHDWINKGLPCHKQQGRIYFFRSEVIDYVAQLQPKRKVRASCNRHSPNSEKQLPLSFAAKRNENDPAGEPAAGIR